MAVDILSKLNTNGSGLNLRDLTASLVEAEIAPMQAAQTKKAEAAQLSISALGQVRAQFSALNGAVGALRANPVLQARSSHAGVAVTVTDASKIGNQSMVIGVEQVAQRQVLEFGGFTAKDQTVGAGALQVEVGVWFDDNGTKAFAVDGRDAGCPARHAGAGGGQGGRDILAWRRERTGRGIGAALYGGRDGGGAVGL